MENSITVKDVSVTLSEREILKDISFTVRKGSIAVILGPNGSGKSTLVKALLGLVPSHGEITIMGEPARKALRHVGYVPQQFDFDLTFPITVSEFLHLKPQISDEQVYKALQEVDMRSHENVLIGKLSGGQLQRVLMARAILLVPGILILDEPTSGVDVEGVKDFYDILNHLNKKHGVTIIMISHEVNIVYSFADTIICLNKRLVCFGNPQDILNNEVLSKLYGPNHVIKEHVHHT